MHFNRTLGGLLLLSLTLCGTACTALPPVLPPPELLADCQEPLPPVERTNAGLAQSVLDYRAALATCNADKTALRAWAKELE